MKKKIMRDLNSDTTHSFSLRGGRRRIIQKNEFLYPENGTVNTKNAVKNPFFAVLNPKNGMGGFVIDI